MIERLHLGKLQPVIEPPFLAEIQIKSFADFIQLDKEPERRDLTGLHGVFREVFPIESYDGRFRLDYCYYRFGQPKMDIEKCLVEGETYTAPLYVKFQLKDGDEIREEEVYMGDFPLMTPQGTFIINGAERVVVSQLHRSPGICCEQTVHPNGAIIYGVRIIPDRGNWIEFQFDISDMIWVVLDQRRRGRRLLVTTFLRTIGFEEDTDILKLFYKFGKLDLSKDYREDELKHLVTKEDIIDIESQTVLARKYEQITPSLLKQLKLMELKNLEYVDTSYDDGILLKVLINDPIKTTEDALCEIYQKLRPGDPATVSNAKQLIKRVFFDPRRFDLGLVGRYKINQRLRLEGKVPSDKRELDKMDVVGAIKLLLGLRTGVEALDDIDHLGNRRVRTIGELLENQCRIGLARLERVVRERMTLFDPSTGVLTPQRLINSKTLASVIHDFFARGQLSQFMDQTNPLSELAHRRRLSALGPGGLHREHAGFEVRDVHSSHYGRICPIETPEGPNIGLISALSVYARVNEFGFIETPYRKVINGKVTEEIVYLTADIEERYVIAQANEPLDDKGRFINKKVAARYKGEFLEVNADEVDLMDVHPSQLVSISSSCIPFLEHDDPTRALMGANMMRQAVPLLITEPPYVATGMESKIAKDSLVTCVAREGGIVAYVSAEKIIITPDGKLPISRKGKKEEGYQEYKLQKFRRSNAGTCYNQRPLVRVGDRVKKGQVITDGASCYHGELALGKNLLVAFMPWRGYNFEDAIIVSERLIRDDVFTSIHIQEFEVTARDTKLGPEEITRDIPNVSEEMLKKLRPDGVIMVGAEVYPGDILVGKVTPKSETELSPEDRLLRAIFGEKAADVHDTSLRVPSGTYGIVMSVNITTHREPGSEEEGMDIKEKTAMIEKEYKTKHKQLLDELTEALSNILLGEKIPLQVVNGKTGEILIPANRKITKTLLKRMAQCYEYVEIDRSPIQEKIDSVIMSFKPRFDELEMEYEKSVEMLESGEEPESGVIKRVKVYLATKKNLAVGDKLAGRHGNKGVVAKIMPVCDMPFMPDGTPVDIILNPLGVPSRMNVGQVLETHLGAACKILGIRVKAPVFDGPSEMTIKELMKKAGLSDDGKVELRDGYTGEKFAQRVVVGEIYMLKLHHLVSDKIHARSVGPYSLVTQQPLGGKAQHGGQRLGEMEVWALEAYGAAYALQEFLTVKSDDVTGRTRIYKSVIKGENVLEAGMPESFRVLVNELRGLCLDVRLLKESEVNALTQRR